MCRRSRRTGRDAATVYRTGIKQTGSTELAIKLHAVINASRGAAEADNFATSWIKDHPKDLQVPASISPKPLPHRRTTRSPASTTRSSLDAQPDNPAMLNNLAWSLSQSKDPKALGYAEKAVKLAPEQPALIDTLGMLLVDKGDTARGVELLQKAVSLAPQVPAIRLNLARGLVKAGRKDEAKKELDELAKLGDKFPAQADVTKLVERSVIKKPCARLSARRALPERIEELMTIVAVVGLGYVGLPLAVEFGKKSRTIGFDLSASKIAQLPQLRRSDRRSEQRRPEGRDASRRSAPIRRRWPKPISSSSPCRRRWTTRISPISRPLVGASESVGKHLKRGATVVFESTVYPGATEEICIPIIEKHSGMKWKQDFFVGYSPERINPGDKERTLTKIVKVVSGDTPETLERVDSGLRQRHHRRRPSRVEHQGGRSRQGHREHAARPQYRADERAGDHLRPHRHRHARSARGRRQQVELPALPSRPGRRPLHRRRSLLPHAQGRDARLPPAR